VAVATAASARTVIKAIVTEARIRKFKAAVATEGAVLT
jgi:hypothetical protein